MVSRLGDGNKYIVVSADASLADAECIRQFISAYLSKRCLDSTAYTYENIKYGYSTFNDEKEMLSQFLNHFNSGMGLRNIFWIFLITPDELSEQLDAKHCDQQIWIRAGKIISQLVLRTTAYRDQISFWIRKDAFSLKSEQILGEKIREYGPDLDAIASYIESAERLTAPLRSAPKSYVQHNKEIVEIVPENGINTLIDDFSNAPSAFKQLINALEMQQISYDEIITIVKKENKTVATATWLVEISISKTSKGKEGV